MKKILLLSYMILNFSYANVLYTSLGCEDESDLIQAQTFFSNDEDVSMEKLYAYALENNCEIIYPKSKIEQIGKPTKKGLLKIYSKEFNKYLYIFPRNVKKEYTEENHLLKRKF